MRSTRVQPTSPRLPGLHGPSSDGMVEDRVLNEILVNGQVMRPDTSPGTTLVEALRDAGLTGTKDACSRGECGACTVLIDGRPVLACLTLVSRVRDPVLTIEGLAHETRALAKSFAEMGALQCGYCTPGQIVTAASLLSEDTTEISPRALDGNLCRCTGSQPILAAINDYIKGRNGCQ